VSIALAADVAVIGAGPAGLSAALAARRAGASVLVLDEYPEPGGQFYKQLSSGFQVPDRSRLDFDYTKGDTLIAAVRASGVELSHETLIWASFGPNELAIVRGGESGTVRAKCIIVATGAYERTIPFTGWDLPGVMTPGGAQTLVKHQQVVAGSRIVLAGSGPFLMPVAKSLIGVGANIVAIVEATRPQAWVSHALRLWGHWDRLREAWDYRRMIAAAGIPVYFGERVVEAHGNDAVERVVVQACDADGNIRTDASRREIEADALCVGYGFVPSVQAARALGCELTYDALRGGWIVRHDDVMQTSREHVFVAGESAGIGGAYAAMAEGTLAGLAAARKLGLAVQSDAIDAAGRDRLHRRRFADLVNELFAVKAGYYRSIEDATLVCRCEEVSAGEVRAAIAAWGSDVNCIKGVTRCGMGYCQGRICGTTVEHLAAQATGAMPGERGGFNMRPPIKPVPVSALAQLDQ